MKPRRLIIEVEVNSDIQQKTISDWLLSTSGVDLISIHSNEAGGIFEVQQVSFNSIRNITKKTKTRTPECTG